MAALSAPIRCLSPKDAATAEKEQFWALKDVSFEVRRGEIIGVIGRNGAGKTTLLKILSRITEPTSGRVEIRGRVASLLEVGTGFHPELTGRENIYLNGAILGMSRTEIDHKFEEIVNFAEVDKFLDTPIKRYSSGMYVRLAFSVAAHLEPDILLVDEVLAVGDVPFQNKCLGKMENVAKLGRTILFVSHNLAVVQRLCSRAILLENQRIKHIGSVESAISQFLSNPNNLAGMAQLTGALNANLSIKMVIINGMEHPHLMEINPASEICINVILEVTSLVRRAVTVVWVLKDGRKIISINDGPRPSDMSQGVHELRMTVPSFFLSAGEYAISLLCFSEETGLSAWSGHLGSFIIVPQPGEDYDIWNMGLVHLKGRGKRVLSKEAVAGSVAK
jgi:lipopolysaccharide transport system ATP-binding protein